MFFKADFPLASALLINNSLFYDSAETQRYIRFFYQPFLLAQSKNLLLIDNAEIEGRSVFEILIVIEVGGFINASSSSYPVNVLSV